MIARAAAPSLDAPEEVEALFERVAEEYGDVKLAFGGPDKKTLYVTAGKTLFKISTAVSGYSLFPK